MKKALALLCFVAFSSELQAGMMSPVNFAGVQTSTDCERCADAYCRAKHCSTTPIYGAGGTAGVTSCNPASPTVTCYLSQWASMFNSGGSASGGDGASGGGGASGSSSGAGGSGGGSGGGGGK